MWITFYLANFLININISKSVSDSNSQQCIRAPSWLPCCPLPLWWPRIGCLWEAPSVPLPHLVSEPQELLWPFPVSLFRFLSRFCTYLGDKWRQPQMLPRTERRKRKWNCSPGSGTIQSSLSRWQSLKEINIRKIFATLVWTKVAKTT